MIARTHKCERFLKLWELMQRNLQRSEKRSKYVYTQGPCPQQRAQERKGSSILFVTCSNDRLFLHQLNSCLQNTCTASVQHKRLLQY